jgi:hypothetical protein
MKKIIVILIIISILTVNLRINFVLAQDNQIDFSSYYLQCKTPEPLKIEELETATETIDYVNEFENFSGKELKPPGFFEGLIQGLITEIASGLLGDLLNSLIGKVPVGASEVNLDIRNSIKETTKNITASIKASIQLAIKDALEYFKFKLISKINDFIYNKILRNYISDINLYRNFRLFLAQQKAINRVLNKYKNLPCIPDDFKWCFVSILKNNSLIGIDLASQSENADKLIKYVNAFMKLQELNILGKRSCEPEEEKLVYENLGVEEPVYEEALQSWGEGGPASAAFNTKPKNLITKIETKPRNVFANIFSLINPKGLLAQFYPSQDFESYGRIFFPFIEKINTEINLRNCSYLISRDLAIINAELEKEKERLGIQFQQPGGFTFKPKTECLKTWTEVEREEVMRELTQAMEKGDTQRVQKLDKILQDIEQRISQQKDITGEDPRCLIPGPTISAPSDYERLKEQILTSPLEFFKSQERAVNTLVAFIRSWLSTKLFKIIDKGFASLESRKTKSEILTDIKNAYSKERIEKICSKTEYLGTPGLTQSCKDTLESQLVKTTEIAQNEISDAIKKTGKILSKLTEILDNLDEMSSTTNAFSEKLDEYLTAQNLTISEEKIIQLEEIKNRINRNLETLNNIKNTLPTSTLEELDNIKNILNSATITALTNEISSTSKRIEELEKTVGEKLKTISFEMSKLYNIGYNNKLMTFFADYPDVKKLISKNSNCIPFPSDYIFYYDEAPPNRQDKIIGGRCFYYNDNYPDLKNEIKLSFYKRFYPTHLFNLNLSYKWIEDRYEKSEVDIHGDREDKIVASTNRYASIYLIAHDLLIILYSLYGSAQTTVDQGYFLSSLNTHINNIISGNFDPTQLNTIQNEIENYLIPYFDKIETYASYTIQYTKNYKTPAGTYLYEFNFRYSAEPNKLTRTIALRLGETLEYLKDLASSYKNILIKTNELVLKQGVEMNELARLKSRLIDLNKQLEEETNRIWGIYLSKLNEEEINKISNELENNVSQINDIMDENYNLCQEYNQLLKDIEEELESASQEPTPSLPEGESYKIQKETKFSLIRRAFDITKNLIASIFNVFNIFKPKKIYIK